MILNIILRKMLLISQSLFRYFEMHFPCFIFLSHGHNRRDRHNITFTYATLYSFPKRWKFHKTKVTHLSVLKEMDAGRERRSASLWL